MWFRRYPLLGVAFICLIIGTLAVAILAVERDGGRGGVTTETQTVTMGLPESFDIRDGRMSPAGGKPSSTREETSPSGTSLSAAGRSDASSSAGQRLVSGIVASVDTNDPIVGAQINLSARARSTGAGSIGSAVSGGDGAFRLRFDPDERDMFLAVSAAGYATLLTPLPSDPVTFLEIDLHPGRQFEITVIATDLQANPVSDVDFRLWSSSANGTSVLGSWLGLLSPEGRYTLLVPARPGDSGVGVPDALVELEATSGPFGTQRVATLNWSDLVAGAVVNVVLVTPTRWKGTVVGPLGEALSDAVVHHQPQGAGAIYVSVPQVDAAGSFELLFDQTGPPGTLRVSHAKYPAREIDLQSQSQARDLRIEMASGIELEGFVAVPTDRRPDHYWVRIVDDPTDSISNSRARMAPVQSSGYFEAEGLAASTLMVEVVERNQDGAWVPCSAVYKVEPVVSGRTWIELEVGCPATLSGTVAMPAFANAAVHLRIGLFSADADALPYDRSRQWQNALGVVETQVGSPFEVLFAPGSTVWPRVAILHVELGPGSTIERLVELPSPRSSIGTLTIPPRGMSEFHGDDAPVPEEERRRREQLRRAAPKITAEALPD